MDSRDTSRSTTVPYELQSFRTGLVHHYNPIVLNRKVLSELAATEPCTFKATVDVVRYQQAKYDDTHAAVAATTRPTNTTTTVTIGTNEHEEDGDVQPLPSLESQEAA
jgi:hypothetical protein